MNTLEFQTITIPNLLDYPYAVQQVELGGILYYFEYKWNVRHEMAYLSVYTKSDNIENYLIKNICLVNGVVLSKNVRNNNWTGQLSFGKINADKNSNYRIDTLHTDFQMIYNSGE